MTTHTRPDLVDRYVSAVVARVPAAQRTDVAAELRTSLADAVEDLQAQGRSVADAEERAVLALGDPVTLAAQYAGQPLHLIGPDFYAQYVQLLRPSLRRGARRI